MSMLLYAVTDTGLRPLPVDPTHQTFEQLLQGCPLGVYSALRTFNHNRFLFLDAHIERTVQSMKLLGWDYDWNLTRFRLCLHKAVTAAPFAEMRVRWDILAEPFPGTSSRELIALKPFTPPPATLYEQGVRVAVAAPLHRDMPLAKTADFAQSRFAYSQQESDAYEYLLVDENGRILECSGANFYGIRDGIIYTAGEGVLAGVTRRILLDLAAQLDIPVVLEPVSLTEINTLDEAALSSSSRALVPIVQIEQTVIGNGRPGPVCRRLLTAYNQFVQSAVKTAVEVESEK